jgi:hypothetical protein
MINHAGAAALQLPADRSDLTGRLSRALARRGFVPVHDRGRVLADTAVLIGNGGRVMSDLATSSRQMAAYPAHQGVYVSHHYAAKPWRESRLEPTVTRVGTVVFYGEGMAAAGMWS